jgi:BclB C-terminal domain-containing protein
LLNTSSAIGFGSAGPEITIAGGVIVLPVNSLQNFAFSMPRDGTITSLSAYFSVAGALTLIGSTITVTAQLYSSATPSNTFTAVPGATVTLAPSLTGLVTLGAVLSGITTGLSIPVTAGTRLLLVFTPAVTAGLDIATAITGTASAGLSIN